MKKVFLIILITLITVSTQAQLYKHHDWDEQITYNELLEEEKEISSVAIKEKFLIQYYAGILGNTMRLFETKHSIIRINDDKGINKHNRVYIPIRNVIKIIDIKARVLQKDGKIKHLDKNNIKELKNVKDYGDFKIFALEGVTADCQLEFIYTLERSPNSLGSVIVQKDYKVRETEVIIRKPSALRSRIKPYNGFPNMVSKKVDGNKEALTATIKNIDAMTEEAMASPEASRMKVTYQVASSFYSDFVMWDNLLSNIQNSYIHINPNKHKSLISDYIKYTSSKSKESNSEIINNICEYVYANYNIIRTPNEKLSNLKYITSKKQATETGIMKVFCCIFNHEGLDYEFVLTSDRFNHKFDSQFFSHLNLQTALFYFIEEKKYLRPSFVNSRLQFAPTTSISNNGIFIDKFDRRFKVIDVPEASENIVERNYIISMNEDNDFIPNITCDHKLTGYRGANSRGAYRYFKKKDLNEFKHFTAVSGIEDAEFVDFTIKNEDISLNSENIPFELYYSYNAESLIEDLGDDFIIDFGKVIGTQSEFYQEAKRVNPVELRSLITYKYKIEIAIPEGFEPRGLEDIKINKVLNIKDELACSFISNVSIDEGFIVINATEIYNKLYMDLNHYEDYKDVVNAAFDFSKKSVLFKKMTN